MEWMQAIIIILSIAGLIQWFRSDIKSDMSRMETDLRNDFARLENDVKYISIRIDEDMRSQISRTDKLYEMYIQLQKENSQMLQTILKQPKNSKKTTA